MVGLMSWKAAAKLIRQTTRNWYLRVLSVTRAASESPGGVGMSLLLAPASTEGTWLKS